ncbi:hypothetical protein DV738_g4332, partial [Chaetothyriales sp. CBS 135597]
MPTLRNLSCQILWADSDAPLREYGTQYGDGVVETYVAVPDKPRRFYIRLTSNGFVHHGLAAIVFMDGTYQCNRNRVNLIPPRQGLPRERSEINFVMRQKEKTIGEGLYMGRQWRFDDHNIVPDPPKMSEGDHFKFLGTIEVVVLRCCGPSKRVHFDYGPLRYRPHSQAPPSTSEWTDDYSDITPEHPTPGNYPDDHKYSTPGSTKDTNNSSRDWSTQSYGNKDVRDGYQSQTTSNNKPSSWSTGMAIGKAEEQYCDKDVQCPAAAVGTFGGNQGVHQVNESTNMTATQNTFNGAPNTRSDTLKSTDGPYWGGVDGTPHPGPNPANNNSSNVASGINLSAVSRPLYGPHGTYFAMQSPFALDTPCDAEEEPRYDVPESYVASYGTTKQVQPGKGYIYTKKRYSPKYIDNLSDPYARFVFIYRTKEQMKNDMDLTLEAELTHHEEVEKLQNVSKDELIQMLIRNRTPI